MIGFAIVTANVLVKNGWDGTNLSPLYMILGTIMINLVYFEPQTTKVMYQRHIVERRLNTGHEIGILKPKDPNHQAHNDPELRQLSKQFGTLHGMSTLFNLGALGIGCYWFNFLVTQQQQQMVSSA